MLSLTQEVSLSVVGLWCGFRGLTLFVNLFLDPSWIHFGCFLQGWHPTAVFFKQKTAYEMQRSLVGSEMCIRDRCRASKHMEPSF